MTCIVTHFFIIFLISDQGLRTLPDSFQNSVNQEQATGTAPREAQFQQYSMSQNFWLYRLTHYLSWYNGCVDAPRTFGGTPKKQEGIIGRVTVHQFTSRPRRLPVHCRPVCAMIQYSISRSGAEGEAAWRVSRDLMIWWDRPNIWCVTMHPHVFNCLWFFANGFQWKRKRKKDQEGSNRHTR